LDPTISELSRIYGGEPYPIGQYGSIVKIHFGRKLLYGYVGRLRMKTDEEQLESVSSSASYPDARIVEVHLFGEGEWSKVGSDAWSLDFDRGVSTFPLPQQTVYLTPRSELRFIYGGIKSSSFMLGEHVGSGGAPCYADLNEFVGKHTAIVGSTGSGKSCTVAAILHSLLGRGSEFGYATWSPRVIVFDPHNEYGAAFSDHMRLSTDEGTLLLPYWMLNLQETVALFIGKTEFAATSQTNIVKSALIAARTTACQTVGLSSATINVDSPVPYSLARFMSNVDSQRPPGSNKKEQEPFDSVMNKVEVLQRDTRMNFLMKPWDEKRDQIVDVLEQFVGQGPALRIVDLSGVPNEVAGITSAVIARTLFNFKLWQTTEERTSDPALLVCEEAHRYVPNRGEAQYDAAQEAIRRIAKEGRKYGLGLMLVSQRPSEVEATVLSQCNSWIVLRITNDVDKEQVRSVLPDTLEHLTKVLSGLRKREAIFVGQATMLPSRILVRNLELEQLPRSADINFDAGWQQPPLSKDKISEVGKRWRTQIRS
jgi:uncharacterized protein